MTAVAAFGLFMSRIESNHLAKSEFSGSGAASLVAFHDAAGYIVMGLLSFLLGACVTVFLFKFRAVREHNREGKND